MKKWKSLVAMIMLSLGIMTGCSNTGENIIAVAGSTALQPLADVAAEAFMDKRPEVAITVQGGGSGTGVNQVASQTIQIGASDFPSADRINDPSFNLVDIPVAGVAFALVVSEDVEIDSLTKEQVREIFAGEITNWKEVGGQDQFIQVINRPSSSGTRVVFQSTVMQDVAINEGIGTVQDSNGAVERAVNSTPGSISYLAMAYLTGDNVDALKTLKIDGYAATIENIVAGDYVFWSHQYMITHGEPTGIVQEYIDFLMSEAFADTVERMGYLPITKLNKIEQS